MKNRRLIFSLFYEDGYFIQSRNFRRQAVGDIEWLRSNYGFSQIASAVDELMILTITHDPALRIKSYELLAEAFGLEGRAGPD